MARVTLRLALAAVLAASVAHAAPLAQSSGSPAPSRALGWSRWSDFLPPSGRGPAGPPVLVGAGDIARCYDPSSPLAVTPPAETAAEATAKLLDATAGTVMAIGDAAYEYGAPTDFETCYAPTWGRHLDRTRPAPGNHEYLTPAAAGYFGYFGAPAAPPLGYYSYDLGSWHVVVLNSTAQWALCPPRDVTDPVTPGPETPGEGRACVGDAAQLAWLAADLAAHPRLCTAVYFHHPRFSSGPHGSHYELQQVWDVLYAHGVDVVVSAHDHLYERFGPQDPDGNLDPAHGIRQFTVGTGGAPLYEFSTVLPNSEARNAETHGVLKLTLHGDGYEWSFLPVEGATFSDAGREACHGPPPG